MSSRATLRAAEAASLRGATAGFSSGRERTGELASRRDAELAVGVREMHLDGADRQEQALRGLAVRQAVGDQRRRSALHRRERLGPREPEPARPRAGGPELLTGHAGEGVRLPAPGEVEPSPQGLARVLTVPAAAQRGAEVDQGTGLLDRRG